MVIASWPFGRKITAGTGPFVVRLATAVSSGSRLILRLFPSLHALRSPPAHAVSDG